MKFTKAIYCSGVDKWYVRYGNLHGIDSMVEFPSERQAKLHSDTVNKSLTRELKKRGYKIQKKL